jgi:NTE family protein
MFQQKKTLGLALGSGGWRGSAHIGVIKTLEKAGIRIDYIAGASVGSLMGGTYAIDRDIEKLEKVFRDEINFRRLLYAFSDPRPSWGVFKGDKMLKIWEGYFGKHKIEKTEVPFTALACDLLSGEAIELKKGDLGTAIRASISVPFVLKPVKIDGRRLIDGGAAVPVPAKTCRQMGADVVIAVNLYKNIFPINPEKMTSLGAVLKSSQVMLHHLAAYSAQNADLILNPDIEETKNYSDPFSGFVKNKGTMSKGEMVINKNIEEIKKLLS